MTPEQTILLDGLNMIAHTQAEILAGVLEDLNTVLGSLVKKIGQISEDNTHSGIHGHAIT